MLWADYFPGMDPLAFWQQLNGRAKTMGITFGPQTLMSNSRKAMEAGEYAKSKGLGEVWHAAVFKAFFTECKDIGDRAVLMGLADGIGLDTAELASVLEKRTYMPVLQTTTKEAHGDMITSAPTFVFEDGSRITGAEPIENFRMKFKQLAARQTAEEKVK